MFSQELENLIQATLEDGVLEQYEKDALIKRAQAEGVDLTELEIYINSILQKRQREQENEKKAAYAKAEQKKKEELGPVCPKCGRQVTSMDLVCECGYEFTSKKALSSVQQFFEELKNPTLTDAELESCQFVVTESVKVGEDEKGNPRYREVPVKDKDGNVQKKIRQNAYDQMIEKKKKEIISSFPVPNTKEDIIEFLSMSVPFAKKKKFMRKMAIRLLVFCSIVALADIIAIIIEGSAEDATGFILPFTLLVGVLGCGGIIAVETPNFEWNQQANLWRGKFDQVLMKGRSLRGDAEFTRQLDYFEEQINE